MQEFFSAEEISGRQQVLPSNSHDSLIWGMDNSKDVITSANGA